MPRGIPRIPRIHTEVAAEAQQVLASLIKSAEADTQDVRDKPTRRKRGVFNGTQGKLKINGTIPGYHLHIMNDDRNRLQDAQDNGYEFVNPKEIEDVSENVTSRNGDIGDSRVRFLVGTQENGQPMYGYLMKIRREWFEEDQLELQKRNDQIDAAIRANKITGENPAFYIPKEGIKLS